MRPVFRPDAGDVFRMRIHLLEVVRFPPCLVAGHADIEHARPWIRLHLIHEQSKHLPPGAKRDPRRERDRSGIAIVLAVRSSFGLRHTCQDMSRVGQTDEGPAAHASTLAPSSSVIEAIGCGVSPEELGGGTSFRRSICGVPMVTAGRAAFRSPDPPGCRLGVTCCRLARWSPGGSARPRTGEV